MQQIYRGEILGLADYETIRPRFRGRVILEKKNRRVLLGDRVSAVFENRDTVLLQIQEMLRTERITREASVQHEIATYNQLVPGPRELSATLMIEIPDATEREAFLDSAIGFERHVSVIVAGKRIAATWDESRVLSDRASAVLYLKFALDAESEAAVRGRGAVVELAVDHPVYTARATLGKETVDSLAADLES